MLQPNIDDVSHGRVLVVALGNFTVIFYFIDLKEAIIKRKLSNQRYVQLDL